MRPSSSPRSIGINERKTKMSEALKVENIRFQYDKAERIILDGVSFSVEAGSYVSLIGHNGSGKSTMAKLIMGLLGDYEGDVYLFGEKLEKSTLKRLRAKIGIVFQNPDNQFVGSTVADDIAFGLENTQVPHEQMQSIIDEVARDAGMEEFLNHEPSSLSGGQKQRVAIAGVLAMKPSLVIFDEATAMLDPRGKKEIRNLILKTKRENPDLTILSITHDIEEAAASDKVIVLERGKILLQGTPLEVFSHHEELVKARLDVPFAVLLRTELEKQGIIVPNDVVTMGQMEEFLWQ